MASVSTTTIRTEPHRRLRPSYSLQEDECSSEEEEELLPPPQSWFEQTDAVDGEAESSTPPSNVICTSEEEEEEDEVTKNCYAPIKNATVKAPSWKELSSQVLPAPHKAPSWKELSSQVLPAAARELLSSSMRRVYHYSLISYAKGRWTRKYSDLGNNAGGYFRSSVVLTSNLQYSEDEVELPPFSSLAWVDRQLVQEWRTCDHTFESNSLVEKDVDDDEDFDRARTLVPQPISKPKWQKSEVCFDCHKPFGPTLLRHHCRLCGKSYCHAHSAWSHRLPHLGYDAHVPERVCDPCKRLLLEQNLAERVAWRLARCRDHFDGDLTPYFETGVDTVEEVASRVTKAAIAMARSIPLGAQAHVAVETVDVLRKHGLKGIYGLILRKEFMAAADLLCRALGINKTAWPLSVHELSAAIFYALAQHRAMRGLSPEREHLIHTCKRRDETAKATGEEVTDPGDSNNTGAESNGEESTDWGPFVSAWTSPTTRQEAAHELGALPKIHENDDNEDAVNNSTTLVDETDTYDPKAECIADLIAMADNAIQSHGEMVDSLGTDLPTELPFTPVCEPVSGQVISSLIFYAPIALNFVYAEREVDMQLLAAQQGWRLLYAHLEQDSLDRPASALFVHEKQKIACFAVRGTATINDVVTDIRQMPVPFPEMEEDRFEDDWTPVFRGQGLAVCGMAKAAVTLYREHIDALVMMAEKGYRLRITGHSLGGGVATLLGALVLRHIENIGNLGDSLGQAMRASSAKHAPSDSVIVKTNDLLRVYGYGTPSCVDAKLSDYVKTFVTTVVLHDDVVPRLTPTSIRGLLKHLLHIRETWVKAHLTDDLLAITERARTGWAPRWRGSFTISKSSSTSFKRYCRKQIQIGKRKLLTVHDQLVGSFNEDELSADEKDECEQNGQVSEDTSSIIICGGGEEGAPSDPEPAPVPDDHEKTDYEERESFQDLSFDSEPDTRLMVDYMGGIDYRTQGVVIDGDEFFDADESLLEDDEEEEPAVSSEIKLADPPLEDVLPDPTLDDDVESCNDESQDSLPEHTGEEQRHSNGYPIQSPQTHESEMAEDDSWARFDTSVDEHHPGGQLKGGKQPIEDDVAPFGTESEGLEEGEGEGDEAGAVMLDEAPLPRMFLPGKIVHVYTHRGGYKAAYVPRAFRELRRISLAGNMLSDHTSKAYYEALLEVQDVRKAEEGLPRWTAFDEDDTCSCCASRFTWASTSDSEAQEARDKHNCRSCGTLVCNPCSPNRLPLPSVGITAPVRVCDRCYNDMGGVLTGHSGHALTSSFMEETVKEDAEVVEGDSELKEITQELQHSDELSMPPAPVASEVSSSDTAKLQPVRERERRSKVVDELASRIHSSSVLSST